MNDLFAVLDACALIAFFNDEPGAERVAKVLEEVPSVNVAAVNVLEVAYDALRATGEPEAAREVIELVQGLPCTIHWETNATVLEAAAQFKVRFRISLADSFALAMAKVLNAPLVTSDHHEFDPIETEGLARFVWVR